MNPAPIPEFCGGGHKFTALQLLGMTGSLRVPLHRVQFLPLVISKKRDMPVIVPPVPTPQTSASTLPSVSAQISAAVVNSWILGFAGFSELLRHVVFAGLASISSSPFALRRAFLRAIG